MIHKIIVDGDPASWTVFTRNRAPTPGWRRMKEYQAAIRAAAREYWGDRPEIIGAVKLSFAFYLPWPNRAPRRNGPAAAHWIKRNIIKKPDLTNLEKAAEDALRREEVRKRGKVIDRLPVIIVDDNQVTHKGGSVKAYAHGPVGFTLIRIEEL